MLIVLNKNIISNLNLGFQYGMRKD